MTPVLLALCIMDSDGPRHWGSASRWHCLTWLTHRKPENYRANSLQKGHHNKSSFVYKHYIHLSIPSAYTHCMISTLLSLFFPISLMCHFML